MQTLIMTARDIIYDVRVDIDLHQCPPDRARDQMHMRMQNRSPIAIGLAMQVVVQTYPLFFSLTVDLIAKLRAINIHACAHS